MIIRIFRPTIYPGKESEFESFLRNTAIPLVSQQSGLMAQHVGKPRDPSSTEYLYVRFGRTSSRSKHSLGSVGRRR